MLAEFLWIDGRASRGRWWLIGFLQFGVMVVSWAVLWPDMISGGPASSDHSLFYLIGLPVGWIGIVNNIRRYHDRDKSGWWLLIGLIPVIGTIWQSIELGMLPGTPGDNSYGSPPGTHSNGEQMSGHGSNGLAKVDDEYLAEYARNLARQQAEPAPAPVFAAPAPAVAAPSFGKRR